MLFAARLSAIILITTILSACSEGPDVPSYIKVQHFDFTVTNAAQGSASNRITDVWVYTQSDLVGGYELPAQFPILEDGETVLYLAAGILQNGMQSTRATYPFYTWDTMVVDLHAGHVITLEPKATYRHNVQFRFVEDFEGNHIFSEDLDVNPDTRILITTDDVYEGNRSGMVHLTQENDNIYFEAGSVIKFNDLPINTTPVYLELNYKNDVELRVGFIHYEDIIVTRMFKVTLLPRSEWNKVYISLEDELTALGPGQVQIAFAALLPDTVSEGRIWLDNIKLLHW